MTGPMKRSGVSIHGTCPAWGWITTLASGNRAANSWSSRGWGRVGVAAEQQHGAGSRRRPARVRSGSPKDPSAPNLVCASGETWAGSDSARRRAASVRR
jgi:hypothetical protein